MAGLLDTLLEKTAGALGTALLKELRSLRLVLQEQVDAYRQAHGMEPLYAKPALPVQDLPDDADGTVPYLYVDILEELAKEQKVPFDETTDLVALGKERGWIDQSGEIRMLPESYKGLVQ